MPRSLLVFLSLVILCPPFSFAANKKGSKNGNSIENILRPPRVYDMKMSPDGKYAASIAPIGEKGDRGIAIFNLDTMEIDRSFKWSGREIDSLTWTTNEDVAFNLSKWGAFVEGVFSVNVNRKDVYPLVANDAVVRWVDSAREEPFSWIWIRDGYRVNPGLVKLRDTGNASVHLGGGNFETASTNSNPLLSERIPNPPGQVYWWGVDQNHEPRMVVRFFEDKLEYLHRYNRDEDWSVLNLDPEEWDIELFAAETHKLYISGYNGHDTKGLYVYNIDTGEIGELLYRDDYYDFSDTASYLFFKDQVIGFRYLKATPQFVWLVPEMESIQAMVDGTIKDKVNIIYDSSTDFSRHLIFSYSDRSPPTYSILDLRAKTLREITKTAPWLNEDNLARTEVFHFTTSDGLKLEGYLTRPIGGKAPYPTICLVHGGPWVRDSGGYDDETQFFANNGYAVLRVNYRGSTGYGKKVSSDFDYDFRKMQDDITESVQLAIKAGIADPEKVAIMGASFGGYSALCGAAFEPDLYKCAITNMGVFDWEELMKSRKRQDSRYSYHKLKEVFGDPATKEETFEKISPIYHIDKVKIPIFVIHGKDDKNVSIKQSKLLRSELKEHGIEHEVLFVGDEGHNIFSLKKRVKTYEQILAFLEKHMDT